MLRHRTTRPAVFVCAGLLLFAMSSTGCASLSNTEKGAAIGAGAGAVVGGVIGKKYGGTATGAIVGAAVGGTAGAVIGQQMDKQAEELEEDLDGAEVDRVGEGIAVKFDNSLLFDFDSAELRPSARDELLKLAGNLSDYPRTDLVVVGHTDAVGSETYNQGLSQRRAAAAAEYLIGQGVAPGRITTIGKGELEPIASNDTDAGRDENRRVEVAIFASDEYREDAASGS